MKSTASRSKLMVVVSVAVSAVFVIYCLYHLEWDVFLRAFEQVGFGWLAFCMFSLWVTMLLRAWRWQIIAGIPRRYWLLVWKASCYGYAGTAIFPARAGEVMRVVNLQRSAGISTGLAIGSSLIDRLVDAAALCVLIGMGLLAFVSNNAIENRFILVSSAVATVALLLVAAAFFSNGRRARTLHQWFLGRGRILGRFAQWAGDAFTELQHLRRPGVWGAIVPLQVVISALDIFACLLLIWAFGWSLPLSAAYLILICLAVASALPSTPGYIGVYQIAVLTALHEFDVHQSEAIAYGTLLQICTLLLFLAAGFWAYITARISKSRNFVNHHQQRTSE